MLTDDPRFKRFSKLEGNDWDWALPQGWVDDFYKKMDVYPAGIFIWSYADNSLFGNPYPLTDDAEKLLEEYNAQSVR